MEHIARQEVWNLIGWLMHLMGKDDTWAQWYQDYAILRSPLFEFNPHTITDTLVVVALLLVGAIVLWRKRSMIPGKFQSAWELLVGGFDTLVADSLGFEKAEQNRKYLPLIGTLFLFLVLCNVLGFIPFLHEPTADVNTPFALGILGFCISLVSHFRIHGGPGVGGFFKGVWNFIKGLFQPNFVFFPLNVIGKIAEVLSISFRLFGNIKGGAIIVVVVSWLVNYFFLPVGLNFFFVFFVGTVQAFVFTMLTLTYISVEVNE